jgi:hypothetical protein
MPLIARRAKIRFDPLTVRPGNQRRGPRQTLRAHGSSVLGTRRQCLTRPVLVPAGFQGGQYGEGGEDRHEEAQIIFCAGHDELSDRYPRLPQANQQERGVGACVDLVIEVGADGTIAFVDLEATSLQATLRSVGLAADGEAVAVVEGRALTGGLPV